jgi:hypothetical protein
VKRPVRLAAAGVQPGCVLSDFFGFTDTFDSDPASASEVYLKYAESAIGRIASLDFMAIETHHFQFYDVPLSERFVGERLLFPLSPKIPPVILATRVCFESSIPGFLALQHFS